MFLEGKNTAVMQDYANKMEDASDKLEFEKAAHYRDQIGHLRKIQEQQYVVGNQGDIDVHAVVINPGGVCVLVMFIRGGRMLGNKTFFPKTRLDENESEEPKTRSNTSSVFVPSTNQSLLGATE